MVGLTPSQFWALTPWEFACVVDGAAERRYYEQETLATMTANLINIHITKGRKARPTDFFRRPDAEPEFATSDEFTAYMKSKRRE